MAAVDIVSRTAAPMIAGNFIVIVSAVGARATNNKARVPGACRSVARFSFTKMQYRSRAIA
jgi:hypothetical protein